MKEKIEALKYDIERIENQQHELVEREWNLKRQLLQLQSEELLKSKLLNKYTYELSSNGTFFVISDSRETPLDNLDSYLGDYHCSFDITKNIYLRKDDWDYALCGTDLVHLVEFAKEQELTIDVTKLQKRKEEAEAAVKSIESLLETLGKE